jgi:AcrR family transcriptional regulator
MSDSVKHASDTKTALIESAELLFAENGVARTSLREITRHADANLASVNYHFGSKENLVRSVLARRIEPLNRERLERLERALTDAPGRPDLRAIVEAFIAPTFELIRRERGGHAFSRLVLRAFSDPSPGYRDLVKEQFETTAVRFTEALALALPRLPENEVHWRFHFMVGAMAHVVALGSVVHEHSHGLCNPLDIEGVVERLTAFLTGGLAAPPATGGNPA